MADSGNSPNPRRSAFDFQVIMNSARYFLRSSTKVPPWLLPNVAIRASKVRPSGGAPCLHSKDMAASYLEQTRLRMASYNEPAKPPLPPKERVEDGIAASQQPASSSSSPPRSTATAPLSASPPPATSSLASFVWSLFGGSGDAFGTNAAGQLAPPTDSPLAQASPLTPASVETTSSSASSLMQVPEARRTSILDSAMSLLGSFVDPSPEGRACAGNAR